MLPPIKNKIMESYQKLTLEMIPGQTPREKYENLKRMLDFKSEVRQVIADYMRSEGCSCCQDIKAHSEHEKRIAELLDVAPYSDNIGFDFTPYRTENNPS